MITKCKQTAENSCSLFYKQKQQFHVIGPLISPLLIIFQLMSLFFSTRVLKTNSAQKTYIFVVKGKKISSKTKNMFIKAWDSLQKTIPPPLFTAMYSPV
jgi:hypothetical protein